MLQLGGRGVSTLPPVLPWLRFVPLHDDRFCRPGQVTLHRAGRLVACTGAVRISFHFFEPSIYSDTLGESIIDVRRPQVHVEELVGLVRGQSIDSIQIVPIWQHGAVLFQESLQL